MSIDKKRILVIDDNPQLVDLLKIRLEYSGFEVLAAFDGKEGLEKARSNNPDLIILDVMLPKINGYKVCRLLKFDIKYKQIPIIMLSSRAKSSDAEVGYRTGANEYLFKPYDPKKLIDIINKHLNILTIKEERKN